MEIQGKLILVQMSESFKLERVLVSGSQLYFTLSGHTDYL